MRQRTSPFSRRAYLLIVGSLVGLGITVGGMSPASASNGKAKGKDNKEAKKANDDNKKNENKNNDDKNDDKNDENNNDSKKTDAKCRGSWSSASAFRPAGLRPRGRAGLYIWHDNDKWNVYATHGDRTLAQFQGTVTFDAPTAIDGKSLERRSDVLQRTSNSVDFVFRNYGDLDGIRFKSSCATTITVTGSINGQPIPVFLGRSAPVTSTPYTEKRVLTSPTTLPPIVVPTTPTTSTTTTTTTAPCAVPAWNPSYLGEPGNLRNGAAAGLYIWIDGDRLRIETTRPNATPSVISGSVVANAPVFSVKAKRTEKPTDLVTPANNGATFTFTNSGGIDGLELRSPCATQFLITATIDGQPVLRQQVWIGRGALTPAAVPVTLAR